MSSSRQPARPHVAGPRAGVACLLLTGAVGLAGLHAIADPESAGATELQPSPAAMATVSTATPPSAATSSAGASPEAPNVAGEVTATPGTGAALRGAIGDASPGPTRTDTTHTTRVDTTPAAGGGDTADLPAPPSTPRSPAPTAPSSAPTSAPLPGPSDPAPPVETPGIPAPSATPPSPEVPISPDAGSGQVVPTRQSARAAGPAASQPAAAVPAAATSGRPVAAAAAPVTSAPTSASPEPSQTRSVHEAQLPGDGAAAPAAVSEHPAATPPSTVDSAILGGDAPLIEASREARSSYLPTTGKELAATIGYALALIVGGGGLIRTAHVAARRAARSAGRG